MPQAGQIVPKHLFPHTETVVNDNSTYTMSLPEAEDDSLHMLFVFASPKGPDGKIKNITDGGLKEFVKLYGQGPASLYGQPYLNAYNAIRSGYVTAHCLRVAAPDATYAASVLVALYKIDETGKMTVKFKTRTPENPLTNLEDMDLLYKSPTDVISDGSEDDGFTEVKLLTVAAAGKGIYGCKLQYGFTSNSGGDKENDFKNYIFEIYENETTPVRLESYPVCMFEDAIVDDEALFIDGVVNSPSKGSNYLTVLTNPESFQEIVDAYNEANEDSVLTIENFDVLLGINKYTREAIDNYEIDTMSDDIVNPGVSGGIALEGGDDGALDESADATARATILNAQYVAAFNGEIDPMIFSRNKFPCHLLLDANYPVDAKIAMAALVERRTDAALILDCGLDIKTVRSPLTYVKNNLDAYVRSRSERIDAICGKTRDPLTKKIITVTDTYALAYRLPIHFAEYGGKHVPFAGNSYGIIDDMFLEDSIYPLYDEDLYADLMDEMVEERINYAAINARQRTVIATQTTRQPVTSNLSEFSNVLILLDIKRDFEKLCATYNYNFAESDDIVRFNKDAEVVASNYADAQVRSIYANFDQNDWEAARGILHLYVDLVHKNLVKTVIIEIDVNKGGSSTSTE